MQQLKNDLKFINQLKNKDFTSWLYVIIGCFLFFEFVNVVFNWEYYRNVADLWRYLDFRTKHEFFTRIVFVIALILLVYRLTIAWILVSGIALFKLYGALSMLSIVFIADITDLKIAESFIYEYFGTFGAFLFFTVQASILVLVLIFLWKSKYRVHFTVNQFHFVAVAVVFVVLLYLAYYDVSMTG